MSNALVVDAGERREHLPPERVVLGRGPETTHQLDRDEEDVHLSREAVVFEYDAPFWTVVNGQGAGRLTIVIVGGSTTVLEPGSVPYVIPHGAQGRITLQTLRRYDVEFTVPASLTRAPGPGTVDPGVPDTSDIALGLGLTPSELQVLACLAEARLLDPSDSDVGLPTHAEVCDRLSLTPKQLEHHLDSIATKLAPHVTGLLGDNTRRATDRRRRVVDYAVEVGAVSLADIGLLPQRSGG